MVTPKVAGGGWRAFGATARGAHHVQVGLPNQDAHALAASNDGSALILAAADGHGDRRCVRADVGSRLAVRAAIECAHAALGAPEWPAAIASRSGGVAVAVANAWSSAVDQHLAASPWTLEERETAGQLADSRAAYGSTVLLAVVTESRLAGLQIGDGDILLVGDDGGSRRPLLPMDAPVAGETWSIAMPDAAEHALSFAAAADDVRMLLIATDGYANSFANSEWAATIGSDYMRVLDERGAAWMADELPSWVAASADAAGDDVTVLVSVRGGGDG